MGMATNEKCLPHRLTALNKSILTSERPYWFFIFPFIKPKLAIERTKGTIYSL